MNKLFWKKIGRIFSYARPFWKLFAVLFTLSAILSGIELINPYLIKLLLDDVLIGGDYVMLVLLMFIFVITFFFKSIVGIWFNYKAEQLEENVVLNVKKDLFTHVESLDTGFIEKKQLGDVVRRLDQDVYSIEDMIGIFIDNIVMNSLTGIFILAVCLSLDWKVTLASLGFFPLYLFAQKYFAKRISAQEKKVIRKGADLLSFMQEMVMSVKTIQNFLLEKLELNRYERKTRRLIQTDLKMNLLEGYSGFVIGFITFTPLLIILWYGGYSVIQGALTVGSLMALYTYIGRLFGPISELGSVNISIQQTLVSVDRVFQFMDKTPKVKNTRNAKVLKDVIGNVEFENVTFHYNQEEPVLSNINFKVKAGEKIGIVGGSGEGKSTLANLIPRFYDPLIGSVKLDGNDLRDVDLVSLRQNVGFVSQETILFNASIKQNIKLGNLQASKRDIINASKLANIHSFISSTKHGYNTIIGERGTNLSGGQKQRISLARTILKNPRIIVLDEATSSLDSESEEKIQSALDKFTRGRTTFIIAHRLSTLKDVDKILVLKDHKVAEYGSFKDLINKKGMFYHYYKIQFVNKNENAKSSGIRKIVKKSKSV